LADSMASSAELVLSDDERSKMQQFLESHGLQELEAIFLEQGVALEDLFRMTDKDMTDLGIKVYRLRKRLQKVIEDLPQDLPAGTSVEQPEPEMQFDSNADSLVQSVLLKVRANLLDPDEAYDEILSMRNEEEETHLNISVASWSLVVRLPTEKIGLMFSVVNTELPGALQAWFNAGENEEESVKLRNILLRKGLVLRMGSEETDLREAVRVWNQRNENLGIIVDEEVEEEVEGSSKWTDRALMLQSGLLTAVEVEESEGGRFIQRIRARYGAETWAPWRVTGDQYISIYPRPPRILQLEGRRVSGYSVRSTGVLISIATRSLDGKEERAGAHWPAGTRTLREFDGSTMTVSHLSGDETENDWSVCFHYQ